MNHVPEYGSYTSPVLVELSFGPAHGRAIGTLSDPHIRSYYKGLFTMHDCRHLFVELPLEKHDKLIDSHVIRWTQLFPAESHVAVVDLLHIM